MLSNFFKEPNNKPASSNNIVSKTYINKAYTNDS